MPGGVPACLGHKCRQIAQVTSHCLFLIMYVLGAASHCQQCCMLSCLFSTLLSKQVQTSSRLLGWCHVALQLVEPCYATSNIESTITMLGKRLLLRLPNYSNESAFRLSKRLLPTPHVHVLFPRSSENHQHHSTLFELSSSRLPAVPQFLSLSVKLLHLHTATAPKFSPASSVSTS